MTETAKIPLKKRIKCVTSTDLMDMDKNDLIDKILKLEAHNTQLKNIISKNVNSKEEIVTGNQKKFDFSKCHYRKILLRIMYFGWDYQGFATQEDTSKTIEHHLFHALIRSCLIEAREKSEYNRCGRTDKGVSSFGQVISLNVRSKHPPSDQNLPDSISTELSYCKILNRLLPSEIRAVAWMPLDKLDFSARFDCKKRQYKYYFPKSSLDIDAMRAACSLLIGSHDFRHLCKMDVGNGVTAFTREIITADILAFDENDCNKPTSMYILLIEGNAFLWHQIRCIMGILLLVGQGRESSDIVKELLDINTNPRRPQYNMALDLSLNLFQCTYEVDNEWVHDGEELKKIITDLQKEWTIQSVKTTMMHDSLKNLEDLYKSKIDPSVMENNGEILSHSDGLLQGVTSRTYKSLFKRPMCSSLEERVEYYKKKRKIVNEEEEEEQ